LVDPRGRHRAIELLEGLGAVRLPLDEGEDRLGVDRHLGLVALETVLGEDLLVVRDDPVVDADDPTVADGVVVGRKSGVALGVVTDVDEELGRFRRHPNEVEELARAGALLVHRHGNPVAPEGVAGGVRAAAGDGCQKRLSRKRLIDAAR
jgi:hypothetical protein